MVAVKEVEERGLGAGGSLAAEKPERLDPVADFLGVEGKILGPERGAFAHRGELRRLEVGVGKTGLRGPLAGKAGQDVEERHDPAEQQPSPSRMTMRSALSVT